MLSRYLIFRILLCINHLCFTVTFSICHSHETAKVNQLFLNNLQKIRYPSLIIRCHILKVQHSSEYLIFRNYLYISNLDFTLFNPHHRHSNPQNITIYHSTAYRKSGMLSMYLFFHIYLCINRLHLTAIYSAYLFPEEVTMQSVFPSTTEE